MKAITVIENLIFPPRCANCGELLDISLSEKRIDPLCPTCRLHYENEKDVECDRCGLTMKFCRCMPKMMQSAQCTALWKLISYRSQDNSYPIRQFVYSIKHTKEGRSFDFIAEQFKELLIPEMRASELLPSDCVITYLPRSHKNKAKDGFDQSYMLAKALSKITGIEFLPCFNRRFITKEQKGLNRFERRLNMRSAYALRDIEEEIKDKTVILVDDIVTTGSSMASCARLLYSRGAFAVMGVCVGLTRKEKNSKK